VNAPAPPAVTAERLTKRYGGVDVVREAEFSVPAGAKVALLGPNGAGKSTLLGMLSSIVTPSAGEATVAGYRLSTNPPGLRRSIGVLAHLPMVYEELSPLENLEFFARLYEVPAPDARIEELLRAVGLWRRRREPTQVFSRGYHQRLAIARALLHRPEVMLLDEPETGLDVEGLALLDELVMRNPAVTVVAATHLIDRTGQWATDTLRLERGRVVERPGAPEAASAPAEAGARA
jgi:heme exporter protein A